jgi:hypothetical protein
VPAVSKKLLRAAGLRLQQRRHRIQPELFAECRAIELLITPSMFVRPGERAVNSQPARSPMCFRSKWGPPRARCEHKAAWN